MGLNPAHLLQQRRQEGQKSFAILIDPDDTAASELAAICQKAADCGVDFFLLGGSLVTGDELENCVEAIKANCSIPVILFPGSISQICDKADAILLLSLISGRNPELLIGHHVLAAPDLKRSGLEIMPTGYLLIDGGAPTTVSYMSNTQPIPADKPEIAATTALAGSMLGLQFMYLDAGSGARRAVSPQTIKAVRKQIDLPLIVGGGIRSAQQAAIAAEAGADLIVVGNALEEDPQLMQEISIAVHTSSKSLSPRD
jgi:putative glycerol-1-phosphate prenyltransferase